MNINQLAILALFSFSFGCQSRNSEAQSHTNKSDDKELISGSYILSIYINNKDDGDKLFKGKEVVVSGRVWDATKDRQRLMLDYRSGEGYGILCVSDVKLLFNEIKSGDNVKVKGICRGMSNKYVDITDCIVLDKW